MAEKREIFGCYVSGKAMLPDASEATKKTAAIQSELFRGYAWGNKGIDSALKKLNWSKYGQDVILILFQFILKPLPSTREHYRKLESYRKKEKSIGLVFFIEDENFFLQPAEQHLSILKDMILQKLPVLSELIKKKKLDTNFEQLEHDVTNALRKEIP